MSEADLPTDNQAYSEFNPANDGTEDGGISNPSSFPVLSVEGLQQLAALPEVAGLLQVMQELQAHNLFLIDRVTQLEATLGACQSYLRLQLDESESETSPCSESVAQEDTVQNQVARLMVELEQSHQTACHQQSLIETMSNQLQTHQERVAQLERACALAQQRYEEQTHDLVQCEQACHELRSRLRWQERYAFQLKTALEKTLDRSQEVPEGFMESLIPCPWEEEATEVAEASTSQPSAEVLLESPIEAGLEVSSAPEVMAPGPSPELASPVQSVTESLFETLEQSLLENPDDALWEELARLIDQAPEQVAQTIATQGTLESLTELVAQANLSTGEENQLEDSQDGENLAERFTFRPLHHLTELPSKSYHNTSDAQKVMAFWEDIPMWPSPVVYPHRNQKRLKSLAAIDLPSFPRLSTAAH